MIDRLSKGELEEVREGRFYQALLAELIVRQKDALARMMNLGDGGLEPNRLFSLAGRAACCEDLIKRLEKTEGREE